MRPFDRTEALRILMRACPSFGPVWQAELVDFWEAPDLAEAGVLFDDGDPEGPGVFDLTSALAHHAVGLVVEGRLDALPPLFDAIERVITHGDEDARNIAIIGVVESMMTISSHRPFGAAIFMQWTGPRTKQAWAELHVLWTGAGNSLAGALRVERESKNGE